ncbi:MAG: sialate O-acetylesterase [Planctomycetota bacterium]
MNRITRALSRTLLPFVSIAPLAAQPQTHPTAPVFPANARAVVIEVLGQSNAEGQDSDWSTLDPTLQQLFDAQSFAWIWDDYINAGSNSFVPLTPGYVQSAAHQPGTANPWFGPEISLAYSLNRQFGVDVFIVKYAVGSTRLHPGTGRDWSPSSDGELLKDWRADYTYPARAEMLNLGYAADEVVHMGVVWAQGYTDGRNGFAPFYLSNLFSLIPDVRSHLHPESPFMLVQSVNPAGFPGIDVVRAAQFLVGTTLSDCAYSATDGLNTVITATGGTGVHLDNRSQLGNGIRIANSLLALYAQGNTPYLRLSDL